MRNLRRLIRYHQILTAGTDSAYHVAMAEHPDHQHAAKQLHARIYSELGYVSADGVDHLGVMTPEADPYGQRARYFAAWLNRSASRELVATGRLIEAQPGDDYTVFQSYSELALFADARALIQSFSPEQCAEVSGLAKRRGESTTAILMLYRAMWHYSLQRGHKLWLMAIDDRLYARLQQLFGDALVPAGKATPFKGHTVIPATLDLTISPAALTRRGGARSPVQRLLQRRLAAFMMRGMPVAEAKEAVKP